MFALVIEREGEPTRRKVFGREANVSLGSGEDSTVVLESLEPLHAVIVVAKDRCSIYSANGRVFVGKKEIKAKPVAFTTARLGPYTIHIAPLAGDRPATPSAPTEDQLLAAIADGDEASRLVYADWLEERGDASRAEYLRLQHALGDDGPDFDVRVDRLRHLGAGIATRWRARVARSPIEGCEGVEFQCPKAWESLRRTDDAAVRFCTACSANVYYSTSIAEARAHASGGHCVALDLDAPRWSGDLEGPFDEHLCPACKLDVGPIARRCPRCATQVRREMMRGRMVIDRD